MATQRPPKTIDECRELLLPMLPEGWSMHLTCRYYDSLDPDGRFSHVEYHCRMMRKDSKDLGVSVEAGTPAKLVKESLSKLFAYVERYLPHLIDAPSRAKPRRGGRGQLKLTYKRA